MSDVVAVLLLAVATLAFVAWLLDRRGSEGRSEPEDLDGAAIPKIVIEDDNGLELTKIRLPKLSPPDDDDDDDDDATGWKPGASIIPIVFDAHANVDEPTSANAFFIVSAVAQTATGQRARNEDAFVILKEPALFGVADGMGGYAGGEVASRLAVDTVAKRVTRPGSETEPSFTEVPRRAAELVSAVVEANGEVRGRAQSDPRLREMGTTVVFARFCPRKKRVYIAHVGDSRCYLLRNGELHQITTDHTVAAMHGVTGVPVSKHLVRALGVRDFVEIDLIFGEPQPNDRYLLCSDGLSRVLDSQTIRELLVRYEDPDDAVHALIAAVEDMGATDNVTAIVVRIDPTAGTYSHYGQELAG